MAWLNFGKLRLKICYTSEQDPLLSGVLSDTFLSPGLKLFLKKIQTIGLSAQLLGNLPFSVVFRTLKSKMEDSERQELLATASTTCSPHQWALSWSINKQPEYLYSLINPKKSLSLARYNAFPSNLIWGRYKGLELQTRVCKCNDSDIETLPHILPRCNFTMSYERNYLARFSFLLEGQSYK